MAVVRFAPGRAVELEYGVDADLPHALRDGSLLVADSNFALVLATAQFPLDGDVSTLGEVAGEVSQFPEGDASMPLGAGFPSSGVILPGRLGSEREHRDVGCVAGLIFGIAAEETDESDSVEVHTFLLFCPFVSGTRKRVGAAPQTRSCFSGGTGTGEPEPERCRRQKQKLRRRRAPLEPRSSAETEGGTGNGPETPTTWLLATTEESGATRNPRLADPIASDRRRISVQRPPGIRRN